MVRCVPSRVSVYFGPHDNENVRLLRAFGHRAPILFIYPSGAGAKWCLAELAKLGAHKPKKRWPWGAFFILESTTVVPYIEAVLLRTMNLRVDISQIPPAAERDVATELLETFDEEELQGEDDEEDQVA